MSLDWLESMADRYARERFDIGRPGDGTYLTRWSVLGRRTQGDWAVYLHRFRRSDGDDALHDHPWPFVSLILAGGYWEHTADRSGVVRRRWYGPGRVLVRPAGYRHRVELPSGRDCWTLILRGKKSASWGFWCLSAAGRLTGQFVPWRSFVDNLEAGALGCGKEA